MCRYASISHDVGSFEEALEQSLILIEYFCCMAEADPSARRLEMRFQCVYRIHGQVFNHARARAREAMFGERYFGGVPFFPIQEVRGHVELLILHFVENYR